MNIVIVGAGKVGFTVASQLFGEGHNLSIIDNDPDILNEVLSAVDVAGICGSGINKFVLEEARAGKADLFIALTGDDGVNMFSCLLAKKLGAKNTIARIRQPEYYNMLPLIGDDMGLSLTVNPEKIAAVEIANIIELPLARKVENFASGKVEMIDYEITEKSSLCEKLVKDVFSQMKNTLVCAVDRGGEVHIPLGDFCFSAGDIITLIAPSGKLGEFFTFAGEKQHSIKKAVISGGGRTSYYLAEQLLRAHIKVTVIERDEHVATALAEALPTAEVTVGDGTSQSVLNERNIDTADAFICLTGIDEENILTSLYVKSTHENIKTITKINRTELVPIVRPLGLGSIVSPKLIAADHVVSYVRAVQNSVGSGVVTMYHIVGDKAEALEFNVGKTSRLVNIPISDISFKDELIIACINRDGKIISPRGGDVFLPGDSVIVVTTHVGFDVLDDIIKE